MESNPEKDTNPSFDTWLTQLDDEEITRLSTAAEQPFIDKVDDPLGLAEALELAIRFRGLMPASEEDVTKTLLSFGLQLGMERLLRDGDLTKTGDYTLVPGEEGATVTLTEQGRQRIIGDKQD